MSREIKFRAWHKCEKKMLNLTKINFISGAAWSDPESKPHIMCHENPECCILMQFTGLKDKNGKEIYEGDIVLSTYNARHIDSKCAIVENIMVVEHDECNPCFVLVGIKNKDKREYDFIVCDMRTNEILGNIYESKHLLNE